MTRWTGLHTASSNRVVMNLLTVSMRVAAREYSYMQYANVFTVCYDRLILIMLNFLVKISLTLTWIIWGGVMPLTRSVQLCFYLYFHSKHITGGYRNVRSCHLEERIDIMKLRELLCCMDLVLQLYYFYIISDFCTTNDSRNTHQRGWVETEGCGNKQANT